MTSLSEGIHCRSKGNKYLADFKVFGKMYLLTRLKILHKFKLPNFYTNMYLLFFSVRSNGHSGIEKLFWTPGSKF